MVDAISVRATITKVVEGYSVRVVIWESGRSHWLHVNKFDGYRSGAGIRAG
jgi:hypothetical protein